MNCLINILSVEKQKSLINLVQNRDETFEQQLESYKKLFLTVLDDCLGGKLRCESKDGNGTCNCDDFCRESNDCYCRSICSHIYSVITEKTDYREIDHFFESIRYCYHRWVNADGSVALAAFEAFLKEYELIAVPENNQGAEKSKDLTIRNLEKRVFYRARIVADLKQYLGKMDMFHVPFSKRYNLRNERFSLTGQPVLYLGNSIPDLLEEMGIDSTDREALKRVRISSFEFTNAQAMVFMICGAV